MQIGDRVRPETGDAAPKTVQAGHDVSRGIRWVRRRDPSVAAVAERNFSRRAVENKVRILRAGDEKVLDLLPRLEVVRQRLRHLDARGDHPNAESVGAVDFHGWDVFEHGNVGEAKCLVRAAIAATHDFVANGDGLGGGDSIRHDAVEPRSDFVRAANQAAANPVEGTSDASEFVFLRLDSGALKIDMAVAGEGARAVFIEIQRLPELRVPILPRQLCGDRHRFKIEVAMDNRRFAFFFGKVQRQVDLLLRKGER